MSQEQNRTELQCRKARYSELELEGSSLCVFQCDDEVREYDGQRRWDWGVVSPAATRRIEICLNFLVDTDIMAHTAPTPFFTLTLSDMKLN